ncbi:MAG TPA: PA14 domain-containing protein, partial [Verrucomicrobiae bacterium]|nr:PA14 domain-containing protein [Verrucomicrobiae bacterium]
MEVTSIARAEITRVSFDPEAVAPASESKGEGLGLLGYYFANTNVLGPVQVRLDPVIDFDWGTGEPITGVGKDYFAIIWMGYLEAPASGEFTFIVIADDRARLQIGPNLVIEAARREQQEELSEKLQLEQGKRYPVTVLYQDVMGLAKLRLLWSGPDVPKSPIPADRLYPASFVTEHAADVQSPRGLLATSYEKSDFSGNTGTRVIATVEPNATSNLTRWTGQVRADYSEPYTFYVATEGPVRLRLDGKPLIDKWTHAGLAEIKAGTRLNAGQHYAVELETMLPARLLWSSPSQAKSVIPETHLTPLARRTEMPAPTGPEAMIPAGVLLRNGSFVACWVESIEDDIVQCSRLLEGKRIPLSEVARIVCQPLSRDLASRVVSGRPGILLANGDFVEGAFVGMEGTQVTISSVL